LETLQDLGPKIFTDALPTVRQDRDQFIDDNIIPDACKVCKDTWPNSLWHSWNEWKERDWTDNELEHLRSAEMLNLIEISLSNVCNQTCMYCGPENSSDWAKILGIQQEDTSDWELTMLQSLYAFIEQTVNLRPGRMTYNFLGGEPLLNLNMYDVIDGIISSHANDHYPNRKKEIMITSNLNVKPILIDRLLAVIDANEGWRWMIKGSIDAVGTTGETVRDGLSVDLFQENLEKLLKNPKVCIEILPSVSVLSLPEFSDLIKWVKDIMKRHNLMDQYGIRWRMGINVVHYPEAMHPGNLSDEFRDCITRCLEEAAEIPDTGNRDSFLLHINNMGGIIGTKRSESDRAEMRRWFKQQGQIKSKDYWSLFPLLNQLCGPAD